MLFVLLLVLGFESTLHAQEAKTEKAAREEIEGSDTLRAIKSRKLQEEKAETLAYAFRPHKPSYLLPLSYSLRPNQETIQELGHVDRFEVKMQFSFKFDILGKFWKDTSQIMFGYTNLAFWQLYNSKWSAPFRETNHEPEFFYIYTPPGSENTVHMPSYRFGLVHQSNGRGDVDSRSWNRAYIQGSATLADVVMSLKLWHRFKDRPKDAPGDLNGDDNPDITHYLGHFEYRASKRISDHTISLMLRNNFKSNNRGAFELAWSFSLNERFKGYFQYFRGHGESLIDYNHDIERFSLGILVADWI